MQETLIKQTLQSEQFHTRLWWMEVIRGAVNIIFGIILFTHPNFTLHILIYALGIYLIIDGFLDIFRIATGKRKTQHKFTNYLFGILSILRWTLSASERPPSSLCAVFRYCKEIRGSRGHSGFAGRSSSNNTACDYLRPSSRSKWVGSYWLGL